MTNVLKLLIVLAFYFQDKEYSISQNGSARKYTATPQYPKQLDVFSGRAAYTPHLVSALYATAQLSAGRSYVNLRIWPTTAGCSSNSGHSSCQQIVFQQRSLSRFSSELESVRGNFIRL